MKYSIKNIIKKKKQQQKQAKRIKMGHWARAQMVISFFKKSLS